MTKKLIKLSFITVATVILTLQIAHASTGACSGHDGVNCGAGADSDGSVICNDGWTGSSVQYTSIKDVCGDDYVETGDDFSDLSTSHKNREAILYLKEEGVISGYPDGTFKPENTVNRAELLKILVGGKGITPTVANYNNCFPDVKEEWFAPYVCYAESQGWVSGYPDGTFQPSKEVNKVEAIKMLVNSQGYSVPDSVTESLYSDVKSGDWFTPFVKVAKDKGLLEEQGSYFSPSNSMSRAGISENIYRAMIVNKNGLSNFSEYNEDSSGEVDDEEDEEPVEEEEEGDDIIQISNISINAFWKSWDADAEDDGFELSAYFKDDDAKMVYPKVNDWTVEMKIYDAEVDYSKYNNFDTHKTTLLHSLSYSEDEVKYGQLNLPYVRVADEDVPKLTEDRGYVWIDATFSSEKQGTFSASDYYVSFYKGS